MSARVYCAVAMTGRDAADVCRDQFVASAALRNCGLVPVSPVKEEGVRPTDGTITAHHKMLGRMWKRDKKLIQESHVVLDLSGPFKSEGCAHEIGYARYALWKPTVRIWCGLGPSIARLEGDEIVDNVNQAAELIRARWGTPWKRFKWRARMYLRCRLRAAYHEAREWFNVAS
jgi:hypothetical protein